MKSNAITNRKNIGFTKAISPRPKTQTEMTRQKRELSFSDARIAVEWLNATAGTTAYSRVLSLKKELDELGVILDTLHRQAQEGRANRKGKRTPPSADDWKEATQYAKDFAAFKKRHNNLTKRLARYTFAPILAVDVPSGIWRYNAIPKASRGPVVEVSDGNVTVQVGEAAVAAALARLAANRELYKVRLCEQCHKRWRISERKIDRFCSSECRREFAIEQPDYNDRQRLVQKRYRSRKLAAERAYNVATPL